MTPLQRIVYILGHGIGRFELVVKTLRERLR